MEQAEQGQDGWDISPGVVLRHAFCIAHAVLYPVLFPILESLAGPIAVNHLPRPLFWAGDAVFWAWIGWGLAFLSPRARERLNPGVVLAAGIVWAIQVPVAFMTTLLMIFGPG